MQNQSVQQVTEQRLRLAELTRALHALELEELQSLWKAVYGHRSFTRSKVYMRRLLRHRFDELRATGTSQQVQGAIRALSSRAAASTTRDTASTPTTTAATAPRDPRLPPPGTRLLREHGGRVHDVLVLDVGCEYEGARYRSLSAVAVKISGGQVNGYAFFGRALRDAERDRLARAGAR